MQFRRMSSTNLMRFAVASFEPMTVIISVVQTTGLSFLTGGKYRRDGKRIIGHKLRLQASGFLCSANNLTMSPNCARIARAS